MPNQSFFQMPYVAPALQGIVGQSGRGTYINRAISNIPTEHKADSLGKFAATVIDPFGTEHAKVPYMPAASSSTPVRVLARGTVTTGSNGYGFLAWHPTYGSDDQNITYTTSTFAGTTIDFGAPVGQIVSEVMTGHPYTMNYFYTGQTDAGASTRGRVLPRSGAWGFRIQNITPAQTRGGQAFMGAINDGQQSCAGTDNSSYMNLKEQGVVKDVDVNGEWNEFSILPGDPRDYVFGQNIYAAPIYSTVENTQSAASDSILYNLVNPCFAWIQAPSTAAGMNQTYLWEIVGNYDYITGGVQIAGAQPANTNIFPTPSPPHHEGLPNLAKAVFQSTLGHTTAAVTAKAHHSTADKVKTFFDHVGHDITNPKAWLAGGASAMGLGGAYESVMGGLGSLSSVLGAGFI